MTTCNHCGAPIEFRATVAGRLMPVDAQPVALITRRGTVVHGWVVHWTTCSARPRRLPRHLRILQEMFSFVDRNGK